jgi:hypothetical protein
MLLPAFEMSLAIRVLLCLLAAGFVKALAGVRLAHALLDVRGPL